ncbi:HAD family hydrolase [Mycolicibacterium thermoresistibile]
MPDQSRPAVLFDIDGTLVDSNYLHVQAWHRAFLAAGIDVEAWRIHRSIGMDGSTLVTSLAEQAAPDTRDRIKDLHSRFYRESAPLLRLLPGARGLLERVDELGLQVVLATSAPEDELALLREVLSSEDVVSAVTSSEDVSVAKPRPDIVEVAMRRAGVDADRAVFVGDTVWDVQAGQRAGVATVGLLSGGISAAELIDAGAAGVYRNAADLLAGLADSPIAALTRAAAGQGSG